MYETWYVTCAGEEMTGIFEEHDDNLDESDCGSVRQRGQYLKEVWMIFVWSWALASV